MVNKEDVKKLKQTLKEKFGISIPVAAIMFIGKYYSQRTREEIAAKKRMEVQRILESNLGYDE